MPYLGPSPECLTLSRDLSARAARTSKTSAAPTTPPAQTCSAAASVAPPANTENRRHTVRSQSSSRSQLQSTTARSVWCLGNATRLPPVSNRNLSPRRASTCSGAMVRMRAAASSMASGMPSRARQIRARLAEFAAVTSKSGRTAAARSVSSRTDA